MEKKRAWNIATLHSKENENSEKKIPKREQPERNEENQKGLVSEKSKELSKASVNGAVTNTAESLRTGIEIDHLMSAREAQVAPNKQQEKDAIEVDLRENRENTNNCFKQFHFERKWKSHAYRQMGDKAKFQILLF